VRSVPPVLPAFDHTEFDPDVLAATKHGHVVSVCLPARNEEATVGAIVRAIKKDLVESCQLVDEIVVVDDHSTDHTAEVAAEAGARVFDASRVLPQFGDGHGKGAAMWKSLAVAEGDLVVWCDADVVGFESHFVTGLVGPLLTRPDISFVKGYYDRPCADAGDRGGRVTELVARPLLALLFPDLGAVAQPLGGEYAGRRELLERLPFIEGYGVDVALLIDVARRYGTEVIAQVDLGVRVHRNRPLDELSPQAAAIIQTVLTRAGCWAPPMATLYRPGLDPVDVDLVERPPLATLGDRTGYRRGA
jgi:glucosyl-3-phosphoglycerate synthase